MARRAAQPWADDELVRCTVAFGWHGGTVRRGAVLRASDPAVRVAPSYFCPDSLPAGEEPLPTLPEQNDELTSDLGPIRIKPSIPAEEAVWCTVTFRQSGRRFLAGHIYSRTDEVVLAHADRFEVRRPLAAELER